MQFILFWMLKKLFIHILTHIYEKKNGLILFGKNHFSNTMI